MTDLLSRVRQARSFAAIAREDGVSREAVRRRFWRELRKERPDILERWRDWLGADATPPLVWVLRELDRC